jgi:hypothetical protein
MHRRRGALLEIVALARERLGNGGAVYYAPSIPSDKEGNARAVHEAHLPESEPVVVLHDATLFGGAADGFLITAERLCWKNLFEHPRQVAWSELEPAAVVAEAGRVGIAGGGIQISAELIPGTARLLAEMAERYRALDAGPYRSGADSLPDASAGGHVPLSRLTMLARRHVGEIEQMYYHPAIPSPKLLLAREVHAGHLGAEEMVAVLYDDTVFGSARDGFLITPRRLCWKNLLSTPESAEWEEIAPAGVAAIGSTVHVLKATVQLAARADLAAPVAELFAAIAAEAQGNPRA